MSKSKIKTINAAVNTDTIVPSVHRFSLDAGNSRLPERDVKHIRIASTLELMEKYEFGENIGKGSFGIVMSVSEKHKNREWAMKIINKTTMARTKMKYVERELRILKMVVHPHIIYLEKVFESPRKIYLILERCNGELYTVFKKRQQFNENDARKIIVELASAVSYLHKNDIVHRDLKMENILIANNPTDPKDDLYIKVTDFGLSVVMKGHGYKDMLHDRCGTLTYMSPEIITNRSYSQQCDNWAIGVILYILLTGHFPFRARTEVELADIICTAEPEFVGFTAGEDAVHLITKLLVKNPALRLTAGEITTHPWISKTPMAHYTPENVLDMMKLWKSEIMVAAMSNEDYDVLVTGTSSKVSEGKSLPTRISTIEENENQLRSEHHPIKSDEKGMRTHAAKRASVSTSHRQSLQLPVTNITFGRIRQEQNRRRSPPTQVLFTSQELLEKRNNNLPTPSRMFKR